MPNDAEAQDSAVGSIYLAGGFLTNSTPLATLPLRPSMATLMSFCSYSLAEETTSIAFSAPEGCLVEMVS